MSSSLLPHALLDLTLARAAARFEGAAHHSLRRSSLGLVRRYAHQSVSLDDLTAPEYLPYEGEGDRSLYSRRQVYRSRTSALASAGLFQHAHGRPLTELERRISELKEAPVAEVPQEYVPSYTETDLISMYENLLAIPAQTQQQDNVVDPEAQQQTDRAALRRVIEALYALDDLHMIPADPKTQYTAAISKLQEIIGTLEKAGSGNVAVLSDVSLLSADEWVSLVRTCVQEGDGRAAETVLDLLRRCEKSIPASALETTMALYADAGDVANAERFLAHFAGDSPQERLRDLHIKAHIRAIEPRTFPTTALSTLHKYEKCGLPAPQRSYTRCITTLLSCRSTVAEAQAWDLFSHMRYVSHPVPDPYLYTVMITACGSRVILPQPARALDLFAEMTVDKGIPPTAASYTAAIYACARSGEKLYVGEAFRLAKEMLDGHRDAYGNPAFTPDRKTFCALLEGAKRTGDLAKVRWILAEIVAESLRATRGDVQEDVVVDEGIMTHVFHAYAAYKPPFVRSETVLINEDPGTPKPTTSKVPASDPDTLSVPEDVSPSADVQPPVSIPDHQFTALLPQSHAEVVGETRSLFSRILNDAHHHVQNTIFHDNQGIDESTPHAFQHVQLTPRLLNAYLSVHYAHSLFDEGTHLYHALFSELKVERNSFTYIEALEHAARVDRRNRKQALKFARDVWQGWSGLEEAWWRRERITVTLDARGVERAYVAMIRILSLTGNLREAVQLVRTFVARYPPNVIRHANPKLALRSTRTALDASRPLVRMFSPVEIPDDTVPPLLSFPELEVLHHKLVAAGDHASIGFIKYVCMSYAGALKRRKEATLSGKPVTDTPKGSDQEA